MVYNNKNLNFDFDFLDKDSKNTIDTAVTINENSDINNNNESCANLLNSNNENLSNTTVGNKQNYKNDNKKLNQNRNDEDASKLALITICIFIVLFILAIGFGLWSEETFKKHQAEIQQITELAYNYKKEKNSLYEETVQKLAVLSNKDPEIIKKELQIRFDNEKEQLLKEIINEMVENNTANNNKIHQCIKFYFNNNKKECENKIKELFIERKKEITKKLVDDWKNKTYDYEQNKAKYLKSLFNNDIKQFNKAMDEQLGYKEFTLVEQPLPESGIIHTYSKEEAVAPFKIYTQQYSYDSYGNSYNDDEHYYIKLIDSFTNKIIVTLFVRSGDEINIDVPLGSYKIKYATGKKWYGENDLFGHDTMYSKSDNILNFTKGDYYVNGHSLTLYKTSNGNFETQKINAKDF